MKKKAYALPKCDPVKDRIEFCNLNGIYGIFDDTTIAKVVNDDNSINIDIYLSDRLMNESKFRYMFFALDENNYLMDSYICINRFFYEELKEKKYLWSLVWHEIGHFHSLPYLIDESTNSYSEQRRTDLEAGTVKLDEQLADLFAVFKCGKEDFIKALQWSRDGRKEYAERVGDNNIKFAVKEFNNRLRLIRKTDESQAYNLYLELLEKNRIR